jgi:hypothetical protein
MTEAVLNLKYPWWCNILPFEEKECIFNGKISHSFVKD